MSYAIQTNAVVPVSANLTLTNVDSGKIFSLTSAAANFTITLPTLQPGLSFIFVIGATAGTNQVQISSPTDDTLVAFLQNVGTSTSPGAGTNIFIGNVAGPVASTVGDRVFIWCDGVSYFAQGYGHVAASIRVT